MQGVHGGHHRLRLTRLRSHGHVYQVRQTHGGVSGVSAVRRQGCTYIQSVMAAWLGTCGCTLHTC